MPKTLTPAQAATQASRAAGIHSRAVDMLISAGFAPLRQFQARGAADSESFEIWVGRNDQTVIVHFYADAAGVELYAQQPGNSWDAMRAALVKSDVSRTERAQRVQIQGLRGVILALMAETHSIPLKLQAKKALDDLATIDTPEIKH